MQDITVIITGAYEQHEGALTIHGVGFEAYTLRSELRCNAWASSLSNKYYASYIALLRGTQKLLTIRVRDISYTVAVVTQ